MKRMEAGLVALLAGVILTSCATVSTDEAAQDMVEALEQEYGIDSGLVQTPILEGDHMSALITFEGDCEVKVIDTGAELRVAAVQGDPIGYQPDLETNATAQFEELCSA